MSGITNWFAAFVMISCVLFSGGVMAVEKPVVEIEMADAADLDAETWGEATEVDGRKCRVLKAGSRGTIPVKPWWRRTLRPKEGSAWLAEIQFKDTASSPIRIDAFAGLPDRYELHRIGGLADNQWKTALVPVPWDMVMTIPDSDPEKTELYISVPGGADLPVASITITEGDAEKDEVRWAEETRAWVDRVQGAKRQAARKPAAGQPALPAALKNSPIVPFVRSTSTVILDNDGPKDGEAGAPLRLIMALNEIEPGQFGVFANGTDLKNVRVSLDGRGLVDARRRGLRAVVELFTAEYSVVGGGRLFPQRFWPAYPVDIPNGRSHLFWLNVETDRRGSRAGTYKGRIRIEADGARTQFLDLEVAVLPIQLLTMNEAGLHIGGCTTGLIPAHELKELARHNHNSINLWYYGFEPKLIRKSPTDFDMDFTIQDDFMKYAKEAGMENFVYFLGGNPYGYPDTLQLERELYRKVYKDGSNPMGDRLELLKEVMEDPGRIHPAVRPLYVKWAWMFMAHAQQKGWPEPLLTPFDEPAKWVQSQNWADLYYWKTVDGRDHVDKVRQNEIPALLSRLKAQNIEPMRLGKGGAGEWIKGHFKDSCAAIHEGWPKARIYGSIHHAVPGLPFVGDIEVFCTNAIHEDNKLGDKVREEAKRRPDAGVVFWQYSGGGDSRLPSEGRYSFGFFFAAFDSRGSLCWAYNWGGRFDTSAGSNWLYGWTTPYSVVRAPFWEGMREAWDDRRYIETLKFVAGRARREKEAMDLLNGIFDQAVKTRTGGGRDTVNDFFARTNDPEALDTMRAKIADMIMRLSR